MAELVGPIERGAPAVLSPAAQPECPAVITLEQGVLVAGRYRLIRPLGAGSSARVWAALDETLGRHVALKALTEFPAQGGHERERLRREARLLATLAHPRITSVYDYLELPNTDGTSQPILVTELIDGVDLATRLHSGALHTDEALMVCAQVADALAAAHASGIVHRDVKPGNVMLTENGAMLLDFGIARSTSDTDLTGANVIGTPACMAPEQWRGRAAQPASDVYALGCLLYWCLSGQRPYPDLELAALGLAHLEADAPPLPISDLAPQLTPLYQACTAKDPSARPSARVVAQLLADQARIAAEYPARARIAAEYPTQVQPPQRSHRRLVPVAVAGTLLAAALSVPLALTSGDGNGAGGSSIPPSPPAKDLGVITLATNTGTSARFTAPPASSFPSRPANSTRPSGPANPAAPADQPNPSGPAGPAGPAGQSPSPSPSLPAGSPSPSSSPSPAGSPASPAASDSAGPSSSATTSPTAQPMQSQ